MEKLVFAFNVLFLLSACGGGSNDDSDQKNQEDKGSISGFITNGSSGAVVSGALVKIIDRETTSTLDGTYEIKDILVGQKIVLASKSGYIDNSGSVTISKDQTTPYDIVLNLESNSSCMPRPNSLIAWWPGDGNAKDYFSSNDALTVNGVSYDAGQIDSAFVLDGVDDYLLVEDSQLLNPNSQITISAWVRLNKTNAYQIVLAKFYSNFVKGPSDDSYLLGFNPNGGIYWVVETLNNSVLADNQLTSSPVNIFDNNFHFVTASYDGFQMKAYFDGLEVASRSATGEIQASENTPIHIGANTNKNKLSWFAEGAIDEPAIFDAALSAEAIKDIYESGVNGVCK